MSRVGLLQVIRRFLQRYLKRGFFLSAISDVPRQLALFLFVLQKRCRLRILEIARRLMENTRCWDTPVTPDDWGIETRSLGTTESNTIIDTYLHPTEPCTAVTPDSSHTVRLADAMYSLIPPDVIRDVPYHSPQFVPYVGSANLPLNEQNEQTVEPNPPILNPPYGFRDTNAVFPYLSHPRIRPVMPEGILRYEGRHKIAKEFTTITVQPMSLTFDKSFTPAGWFKCTHPEGGRYFYHAEKNVYTDADLCDYRILHQTMSDLSVLEHFVFENRIVFPDTYDLVLDLRYGESGTIETKYYYLHHPTRVVFFLDAFEASDLNVWYEIRGVISESHLRHEVEAQYWYHVILYPHSLKVTEHLAHELLDMVLHFSGDVMSSPTSASPFTLEELQKALTLATTVKNNMSTWQSVGATSLVSRLMHIFARSRFYNYYGERHARLERTESVYNAESGPRRTWFIKIASPLLFFVPDGNLLSFQKAYADAIVHKYDWEQIMKTLNQEWKQIIVLATLMLNADVGFLAVHGVEPSEILHRSPAQISIYVSIVCNVGSIALGSLLMRLHKGSNTYDYINFLSKADHPVVGLEKPAILYSLPCALAIWSVVSFFVGVFFLCFERSSIEARTIVGAIAAIITLFSVGTWSSWDNDMGSNSRNPIPSNISEELKNGQETSTEETLPNPQFNIFRYLWNIPKFRGLRKRLHKPRTTAV